MWRNQGQVEGGAGRREGHLKPRPHVRRRVHISFRSGNMGLDGERIQTGADGVVGGNGEEEVVEVGGGREVCD